MRNKRPLITLLGVMLAAAGVVLFLAACSNKKAGNGANTPTAMATMVGETPMATTTPPAGGTPQANAVAVNLTEWIVFPRPASAPAGSVTFNAKNIGTEKHEFMVVKTDLAPAALPTKADGSVDEAGQGMQVLQHVMDIAVGETKSATVNLVPGSYVLLCNVVVVRNGKTISHYANAMHVAFTVTQ